MAMHISRSEKVYQAVSEATKKFHISAPQKSLDTLLISKLSEVTKISPNNISMELNRLYLDGRLLRVRGRPVYYLSIKELEVILKKPLPCNEFASLADFITFIIPEPETQTEPSAPSLAVDSASAFDTLIGASRSLKSHIELAKAAILYPPHGLNTLITGQTGVGKSLFANAMFDYARKSGRLAPQASLITFNCANYSENPQLLMSQLFGHCRGAFTGADSDKVGLVELADKSLLFLDEIHRLNPEGQEKLFLLMDKGVFSRLGETSKTRRADVLLVGATTESPKDSMLSTFLRRIPVHIELPALSERSIVERLQLVLFFFWKEAQNLKRTIHIDRQIISTFVHYDCPTNIGQLSTDVQLTCANAYYAYLLDRKKDLIIEFPHLNHRIALSLFTAGGNSKLMDSLLRKIPIVINGSMSLEELLLTYLIPSV